MKNRRCHVILRFAQNLWQPAILEGGWQILRSAQNDTPESLFHGIATTLFQC